MEYKYFASAPDQEYTKEFLKQIREEDLVVYDGNYTRVISYFCISFVIPTTKNFTEIPVYYSITSNNQDAEKEKSYMENTPLILTGNAKSFEKFVEKLKSN